MGSGSSLLDTSFDSGAKPDETSLIYDLRSLAAVSILTGCCVPYVYHLTEKNSLHKHDYPRKGNDAEEGTDELRMLHKHSERGASNSSMYSAVRPTNPDSHVRATIANTSFAVLVQYPQLVSVFLSITTFATGVVFVQAIVLRKEIHRYQETSRED